MRIREFGVELEVNGAIDIVGVLGLVKKKIAKGHGKRVVRIDLTCNKLEEEQAFDVIVAMEKEEISGGGS